MNDINMLKDIVLPIFTSLIGTFLVWLIVVSVQKLIKNIKFKPFDVIFKIDSIPYYKNEIRKTGIDPFYYNTHNSQDYFRINLYNQTGKTFILDSNFSLIFLDCCNNEIEVKNDISWQERKVLRLDSNEHIRIKILELKENYQKLSSLKKIKIVFNSGEEYLIALDGVGFDNFIEQINIRMKELSYIT